jgi:iron complex outermembrane recepter protein
MFRRNRVSLAAALAVGGVAMLATSGVIAQDSGQRVEVTGSRIKRTDAETASPVQIMSREEIERTGKQSIQEVLRGLTGDGQGSIPTSFSAGFASGSAAVSLRGLGVNSTLVLVNGRRMAPYGLADDGSRNFVDLNSIPLEAVDRVEVLKDGASAIYGADAIGGVVNIILRKSYKGGSIGASYGQTGKNDGNTTRAFGSIGIGDLDADKFNLFATLEATKQKHINSTDRGFIGQSDLRSLNFYDTTVGAQRPFLFGFGTPPSNIATSPGFMASRNTPTGTVIDPNTGLIVNLTPCPTSIDPSSGVCRFNPLTYQQIQPDIDRVNFFTRGTLQLTPSATAYSEVGVFYTKSRPVGTLGQAQDGGVFNPQDLTNPLVVHARPNLPVGHPDNPFGVVRSLGYRPDEFGGRNSNTDNTVTRIIVGAQGSVLDWDWDAAVGYIHSKLKHAETGFMRPSQLQAAIDNGTFRVNQPLAPDVAAAISPTLVREPESSIKLFDFKASRSLMNLAGGPLGLALGGEYRVESASTPPTPFTDVADIYGLGFSSYAAQREVSAVYGELSAPVTKWLELNGALRVDRYSDYGNSTTPKVGIKVKPIDQFAIRGTYAEAFRPPGPAELGGTSFGFTSVGILSIGQPGLKPEEAKSKTLGFIFEPNDSIYASLDFYWIKRTNEIVQADPAAIIGSNPAIDLARANQTFPGAQPGSFIVYGAQGNITTVGGPYQNANSTKTSGFDLELRHRMNLGAAGKLTTQLFYTHTSKYERTLADGTTFEYAGTHGPIVLSAGGGTPKDKATLSFTLDRGPWSGTVAVNYVGPIKMVDHKGEQVVDLGTDGFEDPSNFLFYQNVSDVNCAVYMLDGSMPYGNCKLPSFTTVDLFGKWSVTKNLDLSFSIQNLFDKKAPFDPYLVNTYGINYNQTWHQAGAVGRFFTIGAKYTF